MKSCDTMYLLKLVTCIIKGELVKSLIRIESQVQDSTLLSKTLIDHHLIKSKSVNKEELEE